MLYRVIRLKTSTMSMPSLLDSWKAPLPNDFVATCPVSTTIGMESA